MSTLVEYSKKKKQLKNNIIDIYLGLFAEYEIIKFISGFLIIPKYKNTGLKMFET